MVENKESVKETLAPVWDFEWSHYCVCFSITKKNANCETKCEECGGVVLAFFFGFSPFFIQEKPSSHA